MPVWLRIKVQDEDASLLRILAQRNHRENVREEAGYLFALKLHEEAERLQLVTEDPGSSETAA